MDYKNLKIWQKSINLTTNVYKLLEKIPANEKYNLTSQIKRCSVSIPSNIAEGHNRRSTKSFINFLKISLGSLAELETQLIISEKIKYVNTKDSQNIHKEIIEIRKMVLSTIKSLKQKS